MEIDGVVHPTTKGVPQGGVVSPLLANAVLNKLDWFLHSKGFHGKPDWRSSGDHSLPNVRFARYADDWCVFLTRCDRQHAERLRDEIRDFLRETCGLELSAEKTRITHMRDGYDFLGFNISVGVGRIGEGSPKGQGGPQGNHQDPTTLGRGHSVLSDARKHLGPTCSCFGGHSWLVELLQDCPQLLASCQRAGLQGVLDRGEGHLSEIRHRDGQVPSQVPLREHHRRSRRMYPGSLRRIRCRRITMRHRNRISRAADPSYLEDDEWETAFVYHEQRRPGSGDLKWQALVRDGFHCRGCGVTVTSKTSQADHTEPVNRFANLEMANSLDNIQTLCLRCHKLKTAREQ